MTDVICGACGDILKTIPDRPFHELRFEGDEKELTVWCENCQKLMPDDIKTLMPETVFKEVVKK